MTDIHKIEHRTRRFTYQTREASNGFDGSFPFDDHRSADHLTTLGRATPLPGITGVVLIVAAAIFSGRGHHP